MSTPASTPSQSPYVGHFADNFFWGNTLGEGGNSTVKLIYNPFTEQRMACKIFEATAAESAATNPADKEQMRQDRLRQVRKEYMMLKMLEGRPHENVCKFLGVRQTGDVYFMFFELLTGGELFNHIVPDVGIPANIAKMYFVQICSAIEHMQSLGMAHRDIKGENCLLTGDLRTLKVTDFGWATIFKNQGIVRTLTGVAGTEPYMCPEMHAKDRPYRAEPVDYWSAGVVLIAMLTGEMPWDRAHPSEPNFVAWAKGSNTHMPFDRLTAEQLTFLRRLLSLRPSKRLIGESVLQHPWIRSKDLPEPTRARGVTPQSSSSQSTLFSVDPFFTACFGDYPGGVSSGEFGANSAAAAAAASCSTVLGDLPEAADLAPPRMTGGFTQPARLQGDCAEPLGSAQLATAAATAADLTASQLDSGDGELPMRLNRMLLRPTRFFATVDAAKTQAELLKALGASPELRAVQIGQGTICVTATLPGHANNLAFKICLYLVRDSNVLVEFRRTAGGGLRFNQIYHRLRSRLGHIISRDAELCGLLIAAAKANAAATAGVAGVAGGAASGEASFSAMDCAEDASASVGGVLEDVTMQD